MPINTAFTLRVKLYTTSALVVITVRDTAEPNGRTRLDFEVRHGGQVVFPMGQLWCSLPANWESDGFRAKDAVLGCVAMQLDAADATGYSPEQLAWSHTHGETLDMVREDRYCDANGNVRR